MAIVLEIIGRNDRVEHRTKVVTDSATVGRSFDSDLIIDDPLVSPIHCSVSVDQGLIKIEDQHSLNGISHKKRGKSEPLLHISSGDSFWLGRTQVRVYLASHQVAPARIVSTYEQVLERASTLPFAIGAIALYAAVQLFAIYLQTTGKLIYTRMGSRLLEEMILPTLWLMGAGLLNRLHKRESRFIALTTTTFSLFSLIVIGAIGRELIQFNLPVNWSLVAVRQLVNYVSMFVLVAITLKVALEQSNRRRYTFASIAVVVMFAFWALDYWAPAPENQVTPPQYRSLLLPPAMQFGATESIDTFIDSTQELYETD